MFDLVFLDIQLPKINGLIVGQELLNKDPTLTLVLISSHSQYISKSYHLRTFQYMLKPIEADFFYLEYKRCLQRYQSTRGTYSIVVKRENVSIPVKNIVYVQSDLREAIFYLSKGTTFHTYRKLDVVAEELDGLYFFRCHKRYLVNARWINMYQKNLLTVHFNNKDITIPISRQYQEKFLQQYSAYLARRE